jgi:hypothetical protein
MEFGMNFFFCGSKYSLWCSHVAGNQTTVVGNQTIRLKIVTWLEIKPSRWKSNHPVGNQTTGVKSKQRFFL